MKTTDIESVRETVLAFLYLDIEETDFSPIVVMHPIFESAFVYLPESDRMCNVLEDTDGYNEIMQLYRNRIEKAKTAFELYRFMRKSYRLTFLKFTEKYLSIEDLSKLLADAWITSENPNQDANVSVTKLAKMFRKCDKKLLMEDDEYEVYEHLPEEFTVYRGVSVNRNSHGMSWTKNLKTAEWFAHRFDCDGKVGYIQKATARKKDVLAYFNGRNEDEIVISTNDLSNICVME